MLCETQRQDFERERGELQRTHSKHLAELKLSAELDQARQTEDFRAQVELHRAEKETELSDLRRTMLADTADIEQRAKEQADNHSKVN